MRLLPILPVLPVFALTTLLAAQGGNVLMHHDGTTEATSRGDGAPFEMISVLQRYPWNQCCGRTHICCVEATLQDQNINTPEWCYLEIRGSDVTDLAFPLGKPDMTGGGLLFTLPMMLNFTTSVQKFSWSFPCVPLPVGIGAPADVYVGFRFNPSPSWPADGVSCHFSGKAFAAPGEQYVVPPLPMYAPPAQPGLGWSHNWSTNTTIINVGDLSWSIGAGMFEDVCQPFADNPGRFTGLGGTGLNFNYGYAGIWPDIAVAGDQVGWRVRTVAPPASLCVLLLGFNLAGPIALDPFGIPGQLCIEPLLHLLQMTTDEQKCATDSEAVFGPFNFGSLNLCIGAQAVTVTTNGVMRLSTACTTSM